MTRPITTGLSTLLLMALAACAAREAETYYGIDTRGQNVVFLIDVSGSMMGRSEGPAEDQIRAEVISRGTDQVAGWVGGRAGTFLRGQAREALTALAGAQRELVPSIRGLSSDSRFNVISFGASIDAWWDRLVPADESARDDAVRFVRGLDANGGTPARAALERGFEFDDVEMIFFLSDGIPTDASGSAILRRVTELNAGRGVVVNTIGLGDHLDEQFMRDLARSTGGIYVRR